MKSLVWQKVGAKDLGSCGVGLGYVSSRSTRSVAKLEKRMGRGSEESRADADFQGL
jgi:hypothetical protein